MTADELCVLRNGTLDKLELVTKRGRPLGYASVLDGDKNGTELAGFLGRIGSAPIEQRYAILATDAEMVELTGVLDRLCRRGLYFDQAWPCLAPSIDPAIPDLVNGYRVLLLTRTQLLSIKAPTITGKCLLSNGQVLRTVGGPNVRDLGRSSTVELQALEIADDPGPFGAEAESIPGERLLQASPSSPFAETLRSSHSYYCILHSVHRSAFGNGYVMLRNGYIEQDYLEAQARLAVLVEYDDKVSQDEIVLDLSSLLAIGLPPGHRVGVSAASGGRADLRRKILGNRHCLARVNRTATTDMEKPIARLPDAAFDILGISPGSKIVAESIASGASSQIARITLRALPRREPSVFFESRMQTQHPNYEFIIGAEDLPMINIDLNARQALRVAPGSAVYIRPAVTSILGREFAAISLVMIGAVFSAGALSNEPAAIVAGAIYVVLAAIMAISRLR